MSSSSVSSTEALFGVGLGKHEAEVRAELKLDSSAFLLADGIPDRTVVMTRVPGSVEKYCKAKVVSSRVLERFREDSDAAAGIEYFVSFVGQDQRMDQWVASNDIKGTQSLVLSNTTALIGSSSSVVPAGGVGVSSSSSSSSLERTITKLQFGNCLIDVWYTASLPRGYTRSVVANNNDGEASSSVCSTANSDMENTTSTTNNNKTSTIGSSVVYFCEFCLNFYRYASELKRHALSCSMRHPPGDEIYRKDNVSVFEVDGSLAPVYAQNICYLCKFFIKAKREESVQEIDQFVFFVLCEYSEGQGYRFVGYFSRQKDSPNDNNVACILTMPQHQRKGYGRLLIHISYQICLQEAKAGGPETPLSDLGHASYSAYWTDVVTEAISSWGSKQVTVQDVMNVTGMRSSDIRDTLISSGMLRFPKHNSVEGSEVVLPLVPLNRKRKIAEDTMPPRWIPSKRGTYGSRSERLYPVPPISLDPLTNLTTPSSSPSCCVQSRDTPHENITAPQCA